MTAGEQVFDFQRSQDKVLRTLAVTTPVACLLANALPQPFTSFVIHASRASRNPRPTASRNAIAFLSSPSW